MSMEVKMDGLEFINEEGKRNRHELTVYALSTCGFCKRALKFLRDNSIKFRYVFYDELPHETKEKLKEELYSRFNQRLSFPFAVIDGNECIVGFTQSDWEKKFLED